MNWDIIKGDWKQFKGHVKEQWGKLTDDNLDQIEGKRDQLTGKIQEAYGVICRPDRLAWARRIRANSAATAAAARAASPLARKTAGARP